MTTITDAKKPGAGQNKVIKGTADAAEKKPKGGKKLLIMLLAAVLVALGGAAGAYVLLFKESGPPPPPEGGAMVQMEAMTVTLAEGHFLKVQIAIQLVEGKAAPETFETIRAAQLIIDTFSNREVSALTTNAARKDLTSQLLKGLQKAYPEEVFDVFLTQFVIQ